MKDRSLKFPAEGSRISEIELCFYDVCYLFVR